MKHPILDLANITKDFEDGKITAIRNVALTLESGDYCAIMGRSGSGKSTLLNILGLIDTPTSGCYRVEGENVADLKSKKVDALRARTFGFVFQGFHLVPYLTTHENVELGLTYQAPPRKDRIKFIDIALEQVGMSHRKFLEVNKLSGGERQRVAIARALVSKPRVLLADEPTGNLDEENSAAILELFDEINATGTTVVVVTHELETADRARRKFIMRDGVLSESSANDKK